MSIISTGPASGAAEPQRDDPVGSRAAADPEDPEESSAGTRTGVEAELRNWQKFLEQAVEAGNQFSRLVALELKLAAGDAGRLILVVLAIVPLVILAWLGLTLLLAWQAYASTQSVALGLAVFTLLQLLTLGWLWTAARRYARTLALPVTRRQLRTMMGADNGAESQAKNH
ncbi:MAG: hypothetical protein CME43_06475 [Haliea sp.]|uniref:hypothetical protein n=1 Tax=Haliea sp. TaxID=1932666 RepID=UPI000C5F7427|nr:hypothetical protein [Haliea sp.]MBM69107.1 hypothetical protein [Haliea sp.]